MKKIFFLSDNFPPEHNAAASRVFERGLCWVRTGHRLSVLTSVPNFPEGKVYSGYRNKWFQQESIQGIQTYRVKTFIAPNAKFILRIFDFLSYMAASFVAGIFLVKDNDVIVATSPQLFTAVSGCLLSKITRKPFVFELSDLWPESISAVGAMKRSFALRMLEHLELFLYRQSTAIVAQTAAFKRNLVQRGIDPSKISVVHNGVDLNRHKRAPANLQLKNSLGLDGKFVISYIGTHGMAHDLIRVLDVAEILQNKNNSAVAFLFVGSGAEKAMLVAEVQRRNLKNITFVDPQPKEKIGEYWNLSDVCLVHLKNTPTFSTVIPSKIFEGMAYGKPILLVAPKGESSDIISETGSGVCLVDYKIETFAAAVEGLFENKELYETLSRKSLEAAPKFTREEQARLFLSVIEQVTNPT